MTQLVSPLAVIVALLAAHLAAAPAQAQLSRTFVSAAAGNDANNCDRPTPCRTFQGAHDKTNPDGEITVLDPGGYGAVTITKSISIVNDGVGEAGMLVSGGASGITITVPPDASVNLRGLTIQGIGFGGGTGLTFNSGHSVTISNCVIRNHTGEGIIFIPNVASSSALSVFDSLVADNGSHGILVFPQANVTTTVAIEGVRLLHNSREGLSVANTRANGTINASVTRSAVANNIRDGIAVASLDTTGKVSLVLTRSMVANNRFALIVAANASLRFGQSVITGNQSVLGSSGSAVAQSFGDNYIAGNADGDIGVLPTIAKK